MEEVKKRILELEEAIQHLDFVKRHLNQNASEIKSEIHTSISRHLESMRNREVWLLGQVDTVVGVKEEVLHRQQARLNKALGILHSSLAHATLSDTETATQHLTQALQELESLELKAEETPHIAFRANHVSLRESILSYGRVDSKGLPLQSAFADADKPSASLPRHLEEYEDTEHHVFYKTLQDTRAENAASTSITVCMPKLSTRVEDWLQRPMLKLSLGESEMPVGHAASISEVGKTGSPSARTTCSIQNWLSQIKHNPDLEEEDDFEIVDHSSGQRDSSFQETPEEEEKPLAEDLHYFSHISHDLCQWLHKGSKTSPEEEDLHAFFCHIPQDSGMWLAKACRQLDSLEELKTGMWFRHIPTDINTWLRRVHDKRASTAQPIESDIFAHISHDKNVWLLHKGETARESPEEAVSVPVELVPDLEKDISKMLPTGSEIWLNRYSRHVPVTSGTLGQAVLPGLQKFLDKQFEINTWLAKPAEEVVQQPITEMADWFPHISRDACDWLSCRHLKDSGSVTNLKGSGSVTSLKDSGSVTSLKDSGSVTSLSFKFAQCTGYPGFQSRLGTSSAAEYQASITSPIDSLLRSQSHMTDSDWLCSSGQDRGSKLQGSWSTTSTCSRPSSSQWLFTSTQAPPCNIRDWLYQKHL